jgi:benzoyl-CoA reductase/2-hydroxyglutaryl-CoA dehydratase subunit BcrC/BadD/HgdB
MSSIKNGFEVICETLVSLSEEGNALSKSFRSGAEEMLKKANNSKMEGTEKFCLAYNMRHPDGKPLKGQDAIIMCEIMKKALRDSDDEVFNKLKEAGFIHN